MDTPAPDPAAGAGPEQVVELQKFVVDEKRADQNSATGERSLAEAQQETLSKDAVTRNGTQDVTDALKSVSGVTVTRGADGAGSVSIRGLAPAFNRVTVDGQRQSGRSGGAALDSLPPEILRSIEVTKSLTPDMDGDAIGGVINLTTSSASELKAPLLKLKEQFVINSLNPKLGTRTSATAGLPFRLWAADRPDSGLLVTLSYDDMHRAYQFLESSGNWPAILSPGPGSWSGQPVPAFTRVNLQEGRDHRKRTSVLLSADTRVGTSAFTLKFSHTHDSSKRPQSQTLFDVSQGTPVYLTPEVGVFTNVPIFTQGSDRDSRRDVTTISLGHKTDLERIHLTSSAGISRTNDKLLTPLYANFVSNDTFTVTYDTRADRYEPKVTFSNPSAAKPDEAYFDPAGYSFNQFYILENDAKDTNASAQVDLKLDLTSDPKASYLKFGVKTNWLEKDIDHTRFIYERAPSAPAISAAGLVRTPSRRFKYADYVIGPVTDTGAVNALLRSRPELFATSDTETQLSSWASDYSVDERVGSAYGLARVAWEQWSLLTGLRVEQTTFRTATSRPLFSTGGVPVAFVAAGIRRSYTNVLPGLHLRYTPRTNLFFRSSVNRTLTRPDYGDVAPFYSNTNYPVRYVRLGNSDLKPYVATNLDFSADYYRERWGLLSASAFFKKIENFQVDVQRFGPFADLGDFTQEQKINGEAADVGGVETSWRSDSFEIPGLFKKATIAINYTYLQSRSEIPDRPGRKLPLPTQPKNQGSLSFRAEQGRLSFDVTVTYRSRILEGTVSEDRDRYQDEVVNVDVGASWKIAKNTSVSAGARNLTAAHVITYSGDRSRLRYIGYGAVDAYAGIDWKW